jgi:hypothetical protein
LLSIVMKKRRCYPQLFFFVITFNSIYTLCKLEIGRASARRSVIEFLHCELFTIACKWFGRIISVRSQQRTGVRMIRLQPYLFFFEDFKFLLPSALPCRFKSRLTAMLAFSSKPSSRMKALICIHSINTMMVPI